MEIFKELTTKGYKHYYEGTVEELDSMDKNNQHLHSEIMQVIIWLYEKHGIWISVHYHKSKRFSVTICDECDNSLSDGLFGDLYNSPTEAYEAAIKYCLEKII